MNSTPSVRRGDLDALRALAMFLGIILHASLAYFPGVWPVSDPSSHLGFWILFAGIHGFRMPLFFVMSGYFSALLLSRRGAAGRVGHRFRRVLLPLVAGMVTIVPLTAGVIKLASDTAPKAAAVAPTGDAGESLHAAARIGDLPAIERHLAKGAALDAQEPRFGGTPLIWATVTGRLEAIRLLLARGADVNAPTADGGSALQAAAFLGHRECAEELIRAGAKVNAANARGDRPLDGARLDVPTTRAIAGLLRLDLDETDLAQRKADIVKLLVESGATEGRKVNPLRALLDAPILQHLWFLWFLWWLAVGYAALSMIASRLSLPRPPAWLIHSPIRYGWLIPLTMLAQWPMGAEIPGGFGPDTSISLLPIPHVLAYYAVFFGFGVLMHGAGADGAIGGRAWWGPLGFGLLVVLPLGLALAAGWSPPGIDTVPQGRRLLMTLLQASYPWLMTFGLIGLFRTLCPAEHPSVRYLSDSSYWLYLAHLPLVIGAQLALRSAPLPALAKFTLIIIVVTPLLLWSYHVMVRQTALGRFLNGPREPGHAPAPAPARA
jgi:peptidoglycan/LPS O-acetylase OafA/YrhL